MARVVFLHGWNVKDGGEGTVDTLVPFFNEWGWDTDKDEADYGFIFWRMLSIVGRALFTKKIIKRIVPALEKADLIITHSNGANFATRALKLLPEEMHNTKVVVHFSPALNKKTKIPPAVKSQLVVHTRHDKAVKAAKFLLLSNWGNMGAVGYMGYDQRNTNLDATNFIRDHSDHFHGEPNQKRSATISKKHYEEVIT